MKAWMIWGIILCIIVLLAFMKVGIYLVYCKDKLTFRVLIGKLRIKVGAGEQKPKKSESKAKGTRTRSKGNKKGLNPWIRAALRRWSDILTLVGRVLTAPTLDLLKIHVLVGAPEPDESVLKYGRICSVVGGLLPPLENTFLIKKRDISVECSFEDIFQIDAEAMITLRVYEAIALFVAVLRLLLVMYREINMNKKVVQKV